MHDDEKLDDPIEAPDPEERERARTLATSVATVVGALVVFGGAIFMLTREVGNFHVGTTPPVATVAPAASPGAARVISGGRAVAAPGAELNAGLPGETFAPQAIPAASAAAAYGQAGKPEGGAIVRCTVNEQPVYSNGPCGNGPTRQVAIAVNHGFLPLADRQTVYNSQLEAAQNAYEPEAQSASESSPPRSKAAPCRDVDQAIKYNEDVARRPQPGWRQDQLSEEHRKLEAQKHGMSC